MPEPLCANLLEKIEEQIERLRHLIGLLSPERFDGPTALLLGHLLECLAGFCAVLAAAAPRRLDHFSRLRDLPVNHACGTAEALDRIEVYRAHIAEGFGALADAGLAQRIPTVFVPEGETVLTLLLGNLEHLINHKHDLFLRLKRAGAAIGTRDLYHFRGAAPKTEHPEPPSRMISDRDR